MAAKLTLALIALVIVVLGVMAFSFWYFNQKDEREHEKDLRQMEQTDKLVDIAENDNDDL